MEDIDSRASATAVSGRRTNFRKLLCNKQRKRDLTESRARRNWCENMWLRKCCGGIAVGKERIQFKCFKVGKVHEKDILPIFATQSLPNSQ